MITVAFYFYVNFSDQWYSSKDVIGGFFGFPKRNG